MSKDWSDWYWNGKAWEQRNPLPDSCSRVTLEAMSQSNVPPKRRRLCGWLPATKNDIMDSEQRILEAIQTAQLGGLGKAVEQLTAETGSLESAIERNQPHNQKDKQ